MEQNLKRTILEVAATKNPEKKRKKRTLRKPSSNHKSGLILSGKFLIKKFQTIAIPRVNLIIKRRHSVMLKRYLLP